MRRASLVAASLFLGVASLGLSACSGPEMDPAPSTVLESPELSEPREPHKTADPTPPIRERRLDTSPQSSQSLTLVSDGGSVAPLATPATTGTVNALDRH